MPAADQQTLKVAKRKICSVEIIESSDEEEPAKPTPISPSPAKMNKEVFNMFPLNSHLVQLSSAQLNILKISLLLSTHNLWFYTNTNNWFELCFLWLLISAIPCINLGETHKSWRTGSEILSMAPQPSLSHMVMSWRPSKRQFEASWLAHQNQLVFMDLALLCLCLELARNISTSFVYVQNHCFSWY